MTTIAKLLSFVRSLSNDANVTDVEVDIGGGDNKTAQHFSAPGDDSFPVATDYVLTSNVPRNGSKVTHGYLDPLNAGVALEGEKRIYSRAPSAVEGDPPPDNDPGVPMAQAWLKNDGSVLVSNDNGSLLLNPDGGTLITTPEGTFDVNEDGTIKSNNANGTFVLNPDGSIKGDNSNGSFELQAGGDFVVNGAVIDTAGNINSPATITAAVALNAPAIAATGGGGSVTSPSVVVNGKELAGHTHPIAWTDPAGSGTSGPNN